MPFFSKIKKHIIHILSCCHRPEPRLEIGHPTDFRRGDITIEGLTEEQQAFIREKAISDASRIFAGHPPSPLPSPSPNFPRLPEVQQQHQQQLVQPLAPSRLDKMRQHTRRLSSRFGYHSVYTDEEQNGSAVMLREQQQYASGDGSRRESCEEQQQQQTTKSGVGLAIGEWPCSDEVTLGGGSERAESEKDGSAGSSRGL